jgi:DNA-directed RNA polymerase subunit RPC12/RpoP
MKKVMFSIKAPIKNKVEQFRRWVRYKLNPPRCPTCNTKVITQHGYFEGKINNQDFLVNLHPMRCSKCAAEYINSLDLKRVKCSSCGKTKKGTGYHNKNGNIMTMYWHPSWNGKEHCIDCIIHTIKTGKIETNFKRWNKSTQRTESIYY